MPRTTFYAHNVVPVTIQPNTGLDVSTREAVVEMLNLLLADETVLAHKTRRAEGYKAGANEPDLRPVYNSQLTQINAFSDEIMERVLILGGTHLSGPEDLSEAARLRADIQHVPTILNLLADHETFIRFLREDATKCSEMYDDQGTFAMLVSVLRSHEKMAWLLRSNITFGQQVTE